MYIYIYVLYIYICIVYIYIFVLSELILQRMKGAKIHTSHVPCSIHRANPLRLGSLLALGFGEAGADIIGVLELSPICLGATPGRPEGANA